MDMSNYTNPYHELSQAYQKIESLKLEKIKKDIVIFQLQYELYESQEKYDILKYKMDIQTNHIQESIKNADHYLQKIEKEIKKMREPDYEIDS